MGAMMGADTTGFGGLIADIGPSPYLDITFAFSSSAGGYEVWLYKSPLVDSSADLTTWCRLEVIKPSGWSDNGIYRIMYVLPALDFSQEAVAPIAVAANIANANNCVIVIPYVRNNAAWYGRKANGTGDHHTFVTCLPQFARQWLGAASGRENHRLLGYSKSGYGALSLLLRNPIIFGAAYAWDVPWQTALAAWDQANPPDPNYDQGTAFTTKAQQMLYDPITLLPTLGQVSAGDKKRIGIAGSNIFANDIAPMRAALDAAGLSYDYASALLGSHTYAAGWLSGAAAAVMSY